MAIFGQNEEWSENSFKHKDLTLRLKTPVMYSITYSTFVKLPLTQIENFTVSFSDGIALCCLVNFYHPDVLPRSLINHETTQTCSVAQQEDGDVEDDFFYDNWTKCFSPSMPIFKLLTSSLSECKKILQHAKANQNIYA